jgi:MFS family permease
MKEPKTKSKFRLAMILFGLIEGAWGIAWAVYNNFFPLLLQGGNQNYIGEAVKNATASGGAVNPVIYIGFGIGAFVVGLIMSIDNFVGMIFQPFFASMGDHAKSRKPVILISGIIGAIAIASMAFIPGAIPAGTVSVAGAAGLFSIALVIVMVIVLTWGINLALTEGFAYSLVPEKEYNNLSGIMMFIFGLATVFSMVGLGILGSAETSYLFAGGFLLVVTILMCIVIKEPKNVTFGGDESVSEEERKQNLKTAMNPIKSIKHELSIFNREQKLGVVRVAFIKVFGIFGIMGLQTYASSWIVTNFGVEQGFAMIVLAIYFVGYLASTIPASKIANKIGPKKLMNIGYWILIIGGALMIVIGFLPGSIGIPAMMPVLLGIGVANGIFDVTTLPAAVSYCTEKKAMGMVVSVTSSIVKIAAVAAVPLCGALIELTKWQPIMFPILIIFAIFGLFILRGFKPICKPDGTPEAAE